jgi:hypothetical protein
VWDDYPDRGLYTCRMTRRGVAVSGLQWKSAAFSGLVAQSGSGKDEPLLVHPPLRTARASFPACGSSLAKARSKDPATRLPELPSQYASAVVTPVVQWSANQWRSRVLQAGTHRTSAAPLSSFAFPPRSRFHILSCDVRPVGRGLTFVPGDVPTRIRSITIRHSLLPTSQTHTARNRPCGLSSPKGAIRGFHVSSVRVRRVRCLLWTGRFVDHESRV